MKFNSYNLIKIKYNSFNGNDLSSGGGKNMETSNEKEGENPIKNKLDEGKYFFY